MGWHPGGSLRDRGGEERELFPSPGVVSKFFIRIHGELRGPWHCLGVWAGGGGRAHVLETGFKALSAISRTHEYHNPQSPRGCLSP